MATKTSDSHPLQIAEISVPALTGLLGVTFCPGKKDAHAMSGAWHRDVRTDVAMIRHWGAAMVITLIEPHEFALLQVENLGSAVTEAGMQWLHMPIRDVSVPDERFHSAWAIHSQLVMKTLEAGANVLVHCKGGLGRAGTVAARILIETGLPARDAIASVRAKRPGAIETLAQERYLLGLSPGTGTAP
jgi:ADP-ribosyl-[dinitrogen reductase] hydrolase